MPILSLARLESIIFFSDHGASFDGDICVGWSVAAGTSAFLVVHRSYLLGGVADSATDLGELTDISRS